MPCRAPCCGACASRGDAAEPGRDPLPAHLGLRRLEIPPDAEIRRLAAEQSNSSLIIGELAVLKLVRRVVEGISPETEMTRYLTERGFAQTAPLLGEVVRVTPDGVPRTLVVVQGFVRNQGDGWGWTWTSCPRRRHLPWPIPSEEARQALRQLRGLRRRARPAPGRDAHGAGGGQDDPAFTPEPVSGTDAKAWGKDAGAQIDRRWIALSPA
jgi:maltose alpha-D-glucosyltransferase/alpha-amylase